MATLPPPIKTYLIRAFVNLVSSPGKPAKLYWRQTANGNTGAWIDRQRSATRYRSVDATHDAIWDLPTERRTNRTIRPVRIVPRKKVP